MNETAHTPWKGRNVYRSNDDGSTELLRHAVVDARGAEVIYDVRNEIARDAIVRAVNAHDDMLAALTRIAERISNNGSWTLDDACRETAWIQAEARAAISKATPPEGTRT